jgi:hypothetical protein
VKPTKWLASDSESPGIQRPALDELLSTSFESCPRCKHTNQTHATLVNLQRVLLSRAVGHSLGTHLARRSSPAALMGNSKLPKMMLALVLMFRLMIMLSTFKTFLLLIECGRPSFLIVEDSFSLTW